MSKPTCTLSLTQLQLLFKHVLLRREGGACVSAWHVKYLRRASGSTYILQCLKSARVIPHFFWITSDILHSLDISSIHLESPCLQPPAFFSRIDHSALFRLLFFQVLRNILWGFFLIICSDVSRKSLDILRNIPTLLFWLINSGQQNVFCLQMVSCFQSNLHWHKISTNSQKYYRILVQWKSGILSCTYV